MSNKFIICSCCGHSSRMHFHVLNERMCLSLTSLVNMYESAGVPINLKELKLSVNDHNNFQKLKYFRLVTKHNHGYIPTKYGIEFVKGTKKAYSRVASLNNSPLPNNHECWGGKGIQPNLKRITEIIKSDYRTREEYAKDALVAKYFYNK